MKSARGNLTKNLLRENNQVSTARVEPGTGDLKVLLEELEPEQPPKSRGNFVLNV